MVTNCDRGLENAARGRSPRAAFSSPRSQFFTIRTDLSQQITCLFFFPAVNWLYSRITNGFAHAALVIQWACAPSTNDKKNLGNERVCVFQRNSPKYGNYQRDKRD